ncbi:MAG: EthD family reductase [bacterium]|jgi:uncharacterized protein (TIGR02118 family)|nr:EthD family reductase [bacterium]
MVKLIIAYRAPIDIVQFEQRYQVDQLALAEAMPNLQRITLSLVSPMSRGDAPYHRLVELYFDDRVSLERAVQSKAGEAVMEQAHVIATGGLDLMLAELDRDGTVR